MVLYTTIEKLEEKLLSLKERKSKLLAELLEGSLQ